MWNGNHGNRIDANWKPWQRNRCKMETMATELMRNGNHGYRIDPIGNHGNRTDANWMSWQQNNAKSKPWQQNRCKLEAMATGSMWNGNDGNGIGRRERLNIFIWDFKKNVKVKSCFKKTWYFKMYNQGRNWENVQQKFFPHELLKIVTRHTGIQVFLRF